MRAQIARDLAFPLAATSLDVSVERSSGPCEIGARSEAGFPYR